MQRFTPLIERAKNERIHEKLGVKSWTVYIADVIGKEIKALPVDDRRQIVALLAGEGMSNRAIADAVGVNEITVRGDKDEVRHDVAPADQVQVSHDDSPAEAVDAEVVESKPVTGLDGKTYPAKPKPDVPKPSNTFSARFYRHVSQLQSHALHLEKLTTGQEFAAHVDEVCRQHRDGVVWVQEVIARMLAQMSTDQDALFADTDEAIG